ncbi:nuclear transport factor 2 family protein [Rhizobium lentis]|uniref:nuclear transport factor 2 family protein n=1 Tax=Rhizobium lentis TaxID=1138194 RepID=UPI001C83707F|nr:nuclear transport factor 2 family protein [Rhizobium lentis]MBX5149146.1 nuclear transport factor 2 family protein [Rhizobium lentis]
MKFGTSLALAAALFSSIAVAQDQRSRRVLPPMPEIAAPAVAEGMDANTKRVADHAWSLFVRAWRTGEWEPFLALTTDDFQFHFPQGDFAGLHEGQDGKKQLVAWARYHQQAGNRIRSVLERATYGGDTAVFESAAESMPAGFYRNHEVIIFKVCGDRISALREYWNVLDPGADATGN